MAATVDDISYDIPGGLNPFQLHLYVHLVKWKWKHITTEKGYLNHGNKLIPFDTFLPEQLMDEYPFLYPPILAAFRRHLELFPFRVHKFFHHMADSQAANINLFLPVLLNANNSAILKRIKPDLDRVATEHLDNGFRIEFWDEPYGRLGDKNIASGTDSDIAIAYFNTADKLCLWLIEHKLTEKEFTECGGYKSKGRTAQHDCSKSFDAILADKDTCYYHSVKHYKYWDITASNRGFFPNAAQFTGCPFKSGLNQLWRNQLLALSVEQDEQQPYEQVYFSVVHHPGNTSLQHSIGDYKRLIADNPKFSVFTSADVVNSAAGVNDDEVSKWVAWYKDLYQLT